MLSLGQGKAKSGARKNPAIRAETSWTEGARQDWCDGRPNSFSRRALLVLMPAGTRIFVVRQRGPASGRTGFRDGMVVVGAHGPAVRGLGRRRNPVAKGTPQERRGTKVARTSCRGSRQTGRKAS